MFIGREKELAALNEMYKQDKFQLFVLYGRRRVGKTTLLNEFCKDKDAIFYSAEQSNNKLNLEKFSSLVFQFYGESTLEPFSSWGNALSYINDRQNDKRLILVFDEFPYLAKKNKALLFELQHLIDHKLQYGNLFIILCGSYMGFMEKEVLSSKSPLFGRRTGQLHMKSFDYHTSLRFLEGFSNEEKINLYGAFGGTALYLQQVQKNKSFEDNIKNTFLRTTAYLYEEPLLLLRQEVQEPGVYNAIIEAIAGGAAKSNEITTKINEEPAKCLKYINTLCELGILYKETPFGEKQSSRKTIYGISDFMFRFWYRYIFTNRTLIETGAQEVIWKKRIETTYSDYMGLIFEKICREYLMLQNIRGNLPILFTRIGRWWGSDSSNHSQVEIDIVANEGNDYLICECKWRNEKLDLSVLKELRKKADLFTKKRSNTWYILFSKSGFTDAVKNEAKNDDNIILVELSDIINVE
ncbi:MAG: ATP-binding protein [Clostridia bacterium]|nr:ATP-binding protein [Clostridia bacterium]